MGWGVGRCVALSWCLQWSDGCAQHSTQKNVTLNRRGIANAVTLLLGAEAKVHPFAFDCKEIPTGKTSVTGARQMKIDMLLFQSQRLVLCDSLQAPHLTDPIPSVAHPSDHIPIRATFEVRSAYSHQIECARVWFNTVAGRTGHMPLTPASLRSAFFVFEVDGNDVISRSEFLECVTQSIGLDVVSNEEVDRAFGAASDSRRKSSRRPMN